MKLFFVLDRQEQPARAGQRISGRFILHNRSYPKQARSLSLFFEGKEEVSVGFTAPEAIDGSKEMTHQNRTKTKEFLSMRLPVPNHLQNSIVRKGEVHRGYYEVPFSFVIPRKSPSSFSKRHINECFDQASITYRLRANLDGSGWVWDYYGEEEVTVVAAPQKLECRSRIRKSSHGYVPVTAHCFNTSLAPNLQPSIKISIDKRPTATKEIIKSIDFSIYECTSWKVGSRERSLKKVLGDKESYGKSKWRSDTKIKRLNGSGSCVFKLATIPSYSVPTATHKGKLAEIEHYMKVKVATQSGIHTTIEIPITVAPRGSTLLAPRVEPVETSDNRHTTTARDLPVAIAVDETTSRPVAVAQPAPEAWLPAILAPSPPTISVEPASTTGGINNAADVAAGTTTARTPQPQSVPVPLPQAQAVPNFAQVQASNIHAVDKHSMFTWERLIAFICILYSINLHIAAAKSTE